MVVLAKDLRNSILLYTLQWKLVEQNFEDEPASKLLEKIENKKNELLNTGKLKKEKDLSQIKENEKLFSIPSNWERVKLWKIAKLSIWKTPDRKNSKYRTNWTTNWFSISDMDDCKVITETKEKITDIAISDCFKNWLVPAWTLIMSFKLTIWKTSILWVDGVFNEAIVAIEPYENKDNIIRNYLLKVLPMLAKEGNIKNALKWATLNKESLNNLVLPLPPLEEQKRIVKKLDEIIPKIEEYEELERESTILKNEFPWDVRKAILKYVIQWKLDTQNSNDIPAKELLKKIKEEKEKLLKEWKIKKEKTLAPIMDDEKPFNIPKNWEWIRFWDLWSYKKWPFWSSLTKSMFIKKWNWSVKVYEQKNAIQKNHSLWDYYISREYFESSMKWFEVFPWDIIVSCAWTIWETYVMPEWIEQWIINQALMRMKIFKPLNIDYFLIYFDSVLKTNAKNKSNWAAIKNIPPFEILKNFLVPIPPLEEQKRIVSRVNKLMKLCEELETAVNLTK